MVDDITGIFFGLEQHLKNAARAIESVGTMGWGEQAVLELKGNAAVRAMHHFPISTPIQWTTFCTELKVKFIPSNTLDLVKREWEELSLKRGEHIPEFNEHFRRLRSKLDPYQPMPAEMLADTYGNQGVDKHLVRYIGMHDRTPTLERRMEHLAALDKFLNKSQLGGRVNMNTTTTTKASARKMHFKKCGTIVTAGPAKDNSLTCYNCVQMGHISRNCPNRDLMKMLLEQAWVGKDAPKAKSGRPRDDKKTGGALTGRTERGRLAE
jgi:hypothetical protein